MTKAWGAFLSNGSMRVLHSGKYSAAKKISVRLSDHAEDPAALMRRCWMHTTELCKKGLLACSGAEDIADFHCHRLQQLSLILGSCGKQSGPQSCQCIETANNARTVTASMKPHHIAKISDIIGTESLPVVTAEVLQLVSSIRTIPIQQLADSLSRPLTKSGGHRA